MGRKRRPITAVRAIIEGSPIYDLEDADLEKTATGILLLKRKNTQHGNRRWCLPGGIHDRGVTLETAIIDEVREETGLSVVSLDFLFVHECTPMGGRRDHYVNNIFYANCEGEVVVNEESSEGRYVHIDHLDQYDIAFGHDEVIERFLTEFKDQYS